jgi:hypothetical protein
MKEHNQLAFLSTESRHTIYDQLLALPQNHSITTIPISPSSHTYAVYKHNSYLYIG